MNSMEHLQAGTSVDRARCHLQLHLWRGVWRTSLCSSARVVAGTRDIQTVSNQLSFFTQFTKHLL